MVKDLAKAARTSGLKVIELPDWKTNESNGGFDPKGVLVHHTGAYDAITDAKSDREYAMWLAFTGRSDLPPPLCNIAFSAESVVYICAAGNANHAGAAKRSGPMPAAADGAVIYIGIEAMNDGSQGWDSKGFTADGEEITQFEGYARLCAALCIYYGWDASCVRAHKETSTTGKWDPGLLDMAKFRARIKEIMEEAMQIDYEKLAKAVWDDEKVTVKTSTGTKRKISMRQAVKEIHQRQNREEEEK